MKKINQLKPDVVFLDIQMPQISGIELLSMLDPEYRQNRWPRNGRGRLCHQTC
ncbi:response regulator [Vibrio cholerae]|uniref:response regulator n=1 Tax=Vibrio cholerae TaxID=666 RepID=UPI003F64A400